MNPFSEDFLNKPRLPEQDDPAQLPVEPEFPTDDGGDKPGTEDGESGLDENAAGVVKTSI